MVALVMIVAAAARLAMGVLVAGVLVIGMLVLAHRHHVALGFMLMMLMVVPVVLMTMVLVPMMLVIMMLVPMMLVTMVLVTMMLVIMMLVIMVMVVMVVIVMVMPAVAGLAMLVMMAVRMRLRRLVGAAFRLECGFHDGHRGAEAARHFLQHSVAGDADAVRQQFRRHVAIAEVPGKAGEVMGVAGDDLRHRLLRRHHGNDAAVIEPQPVAILQMGRLGEVQQEGHVPLPAHGDAAAVAAVMRQHHAVGGGGRVPAAGGKNLIGADHGRTPVRGRRSA